MIPYPKVVDKGPLISAVWIASVSLALLLSMLWFGRWTDQSLTEMQVTVSETLNSCLSRTPHFGTSKCAHHADSQNPNSLYLCNIPDIILISLRHWGLLCDLPWGQIRCSWVWERRRCTDRPDSLTTDHCQVLLLSFGTRNVCSSDLKEHSPKGLRFVHPVLSSPTHAVP